MTATQPSTPRCERYTRHGHRCTQPRAEGHPRFCARHAASSAAPRRTPQSSNSGQNAANLCRELLGSIRDFRTAAAINHVLGKLFILSAANRIAPRQASVLAYISQLLLQSLSDVKHEVSLTRDFESVRTEVGRALKATASLRDAGADPRE